MMTASARDEFAEAKAKQLPLHEAELFEAFKATGLPAALALEAAFSHDLIQARGAARADAA